MQQLTSFPPGSSLLWTVRQQVTSKISPLASEHVWKDEESKKWSFSHKSSKYHGRWNQHAHKVTAILKTLYNRQNYTPLTRTCLHISIWWVRIQVCVRRFLDLCVSLWGRDQINPLSNLPPARRLQWGSSSEVLRDALSRCNPQVSSEHVCTDMRISNVRVKCTAGPSRTLVLVYSVIRGTVIIIIMTEVWPVECLCP